MEFPGPEIIELIYKLLPGFIAAWIFYGLTAHPPKSSFERTIQALIFTGIVQTVVLLTKWSLLWLGRCLTAGKWTVESEYITSVIAAVLIGVAFSVMANNNLVHAWLPNWVTKRTSLPSEWFSAFTRLRTHVYLHLKDGRRIYGWPFEFPDSSRRGHFLLVNAEWISNDNERIPLALTEAILIPASDVRFVEFVKPADLWTPADLRSNAAALARSRDPSKRRREKRRKKQ